MSDVNSRTGMMQTANHPIELSRERLISFYETMLRIRRFEERAADLVEAGEIRTPCHFCIGQEAAAAGVCAALMPEDCIFGAHRSHGHYLAKGGDMRQLMAEIFCRRTGCSAGRGGSMHVCAPEVGVLGTVPIVAATIPLAVGAALAFKLRREPRVAVTFFGDGATEEGHFHESLNLAGVNRLPVLFVCENNLYSSHMGIFERRLKDNITASASAHGIVGESVDGNDVAAVYRAAIAAVDTARRGGGPTLIECRTFRWRGHVGPGWDYDVGVKRSGEIETWRQRDPIARSADDLLKIGLHDGELNEIRVRVDREVTDAVDFARRSLPPRPDDLLDHVYRQHGDMTRCAS
jgi:pyruvate dehydrogenase E1 component alpha subunit